MATLTRAYDPLFDPLTDTPTQGQQYAPTYWVATAGEPPQDDGPAPDGLTADVVVVGSGFTGLSTALHLAQDHHVQVVVLEANAAAWGCTSRNGGQGQNAMGRLYRSQWIAKWGEATAKRLDAEIRSGFEYWESLVAQFDCDAQTGGHLYTAHRDKKIDFLRNESRVMNDIFGYKTRMLSQAQLRDEYVNDQEAKAALWEPQGVGVHPLKLAFGYLRRARELGVKVHTSSPVMKVETRDGIHYLHTPGGIVKARKVAFATGGYTTQGVHATTRSKLMPIQSNSMVTRPLTQQELAEAGLKSTVFITDTRTLRFYYRLLPDNSVQIGSRSAISGKDAGNPKHLALLKKGLYRKFPSLQNVPIAYNWSGWVDVSHDMMPRIVQPDPALSLYYSFGYGGNGVSSSAWAGRRLAQRIVGQDGAQWDLPIYNSPLPGHIFAPFRRLGQAMLYHWYYLRDEVI